MKNIVLKNNLVILKILLNIQNLIHLLSNMMILILANLQVILLRKIVKLDGLDASYPKGPLLRIYSGGKSHKIKQINNDINKIFEKINPSKGDNSNTYQVYKNGSKYFIIDIYNGNTNSTKNKYCRWKYENNTLTLYGNYKKRT